MPRYRLRVTMVSLYFSLHATTLLAQAITPTPTATATPIVTPWWQVTEDSIPYAIGLLIAIAAFVVGTLARPLLEELANALQRWVGSWGKAGNFRKRYLDWVVSQNRFDRILVPERVAARAQDRRQSVELEDLYTPLSLGTERQTRENELFGTAPRVKMFRPLHKWLITRWQQIRPTPEPSAGAIGDLIQAQPHLVIRGDPGSGKTTLLRYLAISCARSLRRKRADGDDHRMVMQRFGWKKHLFPIIIPLNLLADVDAWSAERRLLDEMIDTLAPELRKQYVNGFFERCLERGNCLVLFDGFDELGSQTARGKMARLIADLTTRYRQPTNRFIVSTRIVGYEAQLDAYGFSVRTVQDLDDDAVKALVERRYRAIAIGEGLGRSAQAQQDLRQQYAERVRDLLANLARNAGLRQLTTNPLLLSLIVLVHSVKVKLPDERHLLYRDCVEILTEGWQEFKRAGAGLPIAAKPDELKLDHKIVLLREIALTMQQRRRSGESQALIRRDMVETIIAARLPNFIADHLPTEADKRAQVCTRRATALLDDIRENSQILTEKGFDEAGEPVIGFSHLTFQEYLAADAIRENAAELPILLQQLFNSTWREVLLLYVGMVDAGPVLHTCLAEPRQLPLTRYLLAGRCLAEKVNIDVALRERVVTGLCSYFRPPDVNDLATTADFVAWVGGEKRYDWLIGNLCDQLTTTEEQLFAQPPASGKSYYSAMQALLLRLMLEAAEANTRYICGCTLSAIGDPRDLDETVMIPAGEFIMGSEEYNSEKPMHQMNIEQPYAIGKYPVTNAQYQRFVEASGHAPPSHWHDRKPAPWQATQPVFNVSWYDAQAYCRWLGDAHGTRVRLPTEAEWERAARGRDGRKWPWGNEFDPNRANTYEARGDWTTTPVGIYPLGASPDGVLHMAGNVWEWTATQWVENYANYGNVVDNNPEGTAPRVVRGGAWDVNQYDVRAASRHWATPGVRNIYLGFRVVVAPR